MMYVVCVLSVVVISFHYAITQNDNNVVFPCTTPDDEKAYCISLFSCPGLMKSLATLERSAIKYVKQSICLGCEAGDFKVCCGKANLEDPSEKLGSVTRTAPSVTSPSPPVPESKREEVLRTLIPDRRYCGFQHTDDRYYNDSVTALDEFPWLVHIKFTDILAAYKLGDRCTGVLINSRYVLTDSVCAKPALKVRLGQYDVAHKVTCLENPQAHECNEGTIEIRVEKKIALQPNVYETYALTLIRLAKNAEYSDFVRPICLPLVESHRPNTETALVFSGWGAKPTARDVEDAIKKRLVYDMAQMEDCAKYNSVVNSFKGKDLTELNCFAPQKSNKDSACSGDHGGPLMYSDSRHQWYVEHVVVDVTGGLSFTGCGEKYPVVAAKITPDVIEAILENIEP